MKKLLCQWFLLCQNVATTTLMHPVLRNLCVPHKFPRCPC
jgi:hypothetical protein